MRQFNAYLERALRRERRQQRDRIVATTIGMSGGDALKVALKQLDD